MRAPAQQYSGVVRKANSEREVSYSGTSRESTEHHLLSQLPRPVRDISNGLGQPLLAPVDPSRSTTSGVGIEGEKQAWPAPVRPTPSTGLPGAMGYRHDCEADGPPGTPAAARQLLLLWELPHAAWVKSCPAACNYNATAGQRHVCRARVTSPVPISHDPRRRRSERDPRVPIPGRGRR